MSKNNFLYISTICLYHEDARDAQVFDLLIPYLQNNFPGISVEERGHFWSVIPLGTGQRDAEVERIARRISGSKVRNLQEPVTSFEALSGEVAYEAKRLQDPRIHSFGILYDGFIFQSILREFFPEEDLELSKVHIIYTHRLLGTWDKNECRYHARVSIYGFPSVLSLSGLVEAPAKPREYYFLRQRIGIQAADHLGMMRLRENLRGKFLVHGDVRLPEAAKGYALQAIFYQLTGDPFCSDPYCRLYNAHWQEELIRAQLESPYELCPNHQRILDLLGRRMKKILREEENEPIGDGP